MTYYPPTLAQSHHPPYVMMVVASLTILNFNFGQGVNNTLSANKASWPE